MIVCQFYTLDSYKNKKGAYIPLPQFGPTNTLLAWTSAAYSLLYPVCRCGERHLQTLRAEMCLIAEPANG